MTKYQGRCLCGEIRWHTPNAPIWTCHCHCESCRRNCSAPLTSFMGFNHDSVTWQGKRRFYQSSPGVSRGFCPNCGTPISFESTNWPGEIHLYAASLETPQAYRAERHVYWGEKLPWTDWQDDLPKNAGSG